MRNVYVVTKGYGEPPLAVTYEEELAGALAKNTGGKHYAVPLVMSDRISSDLAPSLFRPKVRDASGEQA